MKRISRIGACLSLLLLVSLLLSACELLGELSFCFTCLGKKTVACHTCTGEGETVCAECGGTAKRKCTVCFGTGRRPCSMCSGSGMRWQSDYFTGGFSMRPCGYCLGGYQSCYLCVGGERACQCLEGRVSCPDCNGNKTVSCPDCTESTPAP